MSSDANTSVDAVRKLDNAVIAAAVGLAEYEQRFATGVSRSLTNHPLCRLLDAVEALHAAHEPACPHCGRGVTSGAVTHNPEWAPTKCARCVSAAEAEDRRYQSIGRVVELRLSQMSPDRRARAAHDVIGKNWRDLFPFPAASSDGGEQ